LRIRSFVLLTVEEQVVKVPKNAEVLASSAFFYVNVEGDFSTLQPNVPRLFIPHGRAVNEPSVGDEGKPRLMEVSFISQLQPALYPFHLSLKKLFRFWTT
jgi:hypothetical protein